LREIENHKRELAGAPPEEAQGGLIFRPGKEGSAAASVTLHQDVERKR
jgi:hypothetical protein